MLGYLGDRRMLTKRGQDSQWSRADQSSPVQLRAANTLSPINNLEPRPPPAPECKHTDRGPLWQVHKISCKLQCSVLCWGFAKHTHIHHTQPQTSYS